MFEINALEFLPENLLGGIIHDLYTPYNLPSEGLRYNFAWIDADVLGLAYEKYLATVLAPIPQPDTLQLALFNQPVREVERKSVRKATGVYYTPTQLVRFLVESCFDNLADEISPRSIPVVADFACGSGSFLVSAASSLIARLRKHDPTKNWARELVNSKKIIGIEIDKRAVTMARLALWLRFAEEPQPLPLPRLEEIIVQGDSLGEEVWNSVPKEYDVILGNPPFLAAGRTPKRSDLPLRFQSAKGKYDYSYLFVELGINHLSEHGVLGMVIPNRLFMNQDANLIREIISTQTNIKNIVDFGSNEVFEGISAYIGMLTAQKRGELESDSLRVIKVRDMRPSFLSALLLQASIQGTDIENETLQAYDSSPHPRGKNPWLLLAPQDKTRRIVLENEGVSLEEIAIIKQGIRTGANDIFIVEIESGKDEFLVKVVNGVGDYGLVERSFLQPVVFGSQIRKYERLKPSRYLIYPYRNGIPISEHELQERYPHAFAYLARYKESLASRTSLGNKRWYELVRSRDINWLNKPKLVIRDLATETSFSVDDKGGIFLVGGTAVIPGSPELLLPLLAYLNSNLISNYISQTTPSFRGGFQKFEPQHLQNIPIHRKILEDDFCERLSSLAERIISTKELMLDDDDEESIDSVIKETDDLIACQVNV